MQHTPRWVAVSTLPFVFVGCVLPPEPSFPPPPGPPASRYFVAGIDASSRTAASSEDGLKILDARAGHALRPGITVAFFPPDKCRNIAAASTAATAEDAELANDCGVLISALETSVAGRYGVVSWQTLKGDDPFARAAARNVDMIFEVDSFGMNRLGQDAASDVNIDFFEQSNASDRTPLVLGPTELGPVGQRCKGWVDHYDAQRQQAGMVGSFTGAIKAVEVKSGQALLYYQRTLTNEPGAESQGKYDLYFESKGTQDYDPPAPPPRTHNRLQKGGAAATVAGALMVVLGGTLRATVFKGRDADGDGQKEFRQPGTGASAGVAFGGIFVLGGGVTMLVLGNRKAKKGTPTKIEYEPPPPRYQPPADVLCGPQAVPPWLTPAAGSPAVDPAAQGGSSISFSEQKRAGRDLARDRENRLRKLVIDDFASALAGLGEG